MAGTGSTWWIDDPIATQADDGLERMPFVERATLMLDEIGAHPSSTVVALVGPWGSGKTSTVNLILDSLDPERWAAARFNPWALGSAEAIVSELLATIASALPGRARRAKERLADYAEIAVPLLSLIPLAGDAAGGAGEVLAKRLRGDGTLQTRLGQLAGELSELTRSVLVFVDDVDRLQPDELLALFRAVRVLGRLPHVHYLVAYDQRTVVDLLRATPVANDKESRALTFLEKIVSLRVDQPLIRAEQSALLFNRRLTELLGELEADLGDDERRRLADEWEQVLAADLAEPRGINRFIAQLRVHLPLIGRSEVDLVDFIVITHLRGAFPQLYRALLADRSALAGAGPEERLAAWRAGTPIRKLRLHDEVGERLEAAVGRMFPALEPNRRTAPRSKGIGHPDYVDRYFTFITSASELTDADLAAALRDWSRGVASDRLTAALTPDPANQYECARSANVLRRLDGLVDQAGPAEAACLLRSAAGFLPLPAGPGLILGGPDAAMVHWLKHLIRKADPLDAEELVGSVARRGIAPLVSLLRAVPGDSAMAVTAADVGWRLFVDHVAAGDEAPDAPAESLFALVDDLLGSAETDQRLRDAIDDGLPLPHLAARLVQVGTAGPGRPVLMGLDLKTLEARLDRSRVLAGRGDASGEAADRNDASWSGRRRYAEAAIREAAEGGPTSG